MVASSKKLLVLDINGLLIDSYYQQEPRPDRPHDAKVNRFYVYKRPFCNEFMQFCFENFVVGVWSSAREHNVYSLVEYMFKEAKEKLAFVWHQQHCTDTGFKHPEKKHKPVFLKELWRLWEKNEPDLPWEAGDYDTSNTLLIDDSAYKAIKNPEHTAIFPKTYKATDSEDNYLEGELRTYLEGLLLTGNVQAYVQKNPIGEPSIAIGDPSWSQILDSVIKMKDEMELVPPALRWTDGRASRNIEGNSSIPHGIHYVQTVQEANGNGLCERQDLLSLLRGEHESCNFALSGWGSSISEIAATSSWSSQLRSVEAGHMLLGKSSFTSCYPSQKKYLGRPGYNEENFEGADGTHHNNYRPGVDSRKRIRDHEVTQTDWPLVQKEPHRSVSRDSIRGRSRSTEEYHLREAHGSYISRVRVLEDTRALWSVEQKDSTGGQSRDSSRAGVRDQENHRDEDPRAWSTERHNCHHKVTPGHDYKEERLSRAESQQLSDREYYQNGDISEAPQSINSWGGEESGKGFSRSQHQGSERSKDSHSSSRGWGREQGYGRGFRRSSWRKQERSEDSQSCRGGGRDYGKGPRWSSLHRKERSEDSQSSRGRSTEKDYGKGSRLQKHGGTDDGFQSRSSKS